MPLGPFDLNGPAFLQLYGVLFVLATLAALTVPHLLRPEGGAARTLSADEIAYLSGGRDRFCDTIVARLIAQGALAIGAGDRFWILTPGSGRTPAERRLLALPDRSKWSAVAATLAEAAPAVERRLVDAQLLMEAGARMWMRLWQSMPYLLLIGFGAIKLEVGAARDRPVGYLTLLLLLTTGSALVRFLVLDRRTRAGRRTVAEARANAGRLRRAPTASEADIAVALFGTAVLAGSPWAEYHRLRSASSGDGGSGGDSSSSSDGGGDGGGGCGGCGGD